MNLTFDIGVRLDDLLEREWLLTNRLGGYASSTIPSLNTRKYHGLLVAAMAPPVRRLVLLSRVEETIHCDGWPTPLACNEYPGAIHPNGHEELRAFAHEPFPRWAYQGEGWAIEKSLQLLPGQNTVVLTYTLLIAKKPVELELRPLLALRPMHDLMYQWNGNLAATEKSPAQWRVPPTSRTPEVFFAHDDAGVFDATAALWYFNTIYRREGERGYAGLEDLWSPGAIKWTLRPGESVHFVCSADPIDFAKVVAAAESECAPSDVAEAIGLSPPRDTDRDTDHDLLLRAAERFVLELPKELTEKTPVGVMTRFPWSPPSVRDALIALPGLLLVTGKFGLAKQVLLGLAARLQQGLIPTEFPEDGSPPTYNGADTSLWFVNAVWQYQRYSGDASGTKKLFDAVDQIIRAYHRGADLGICTDNEKLLCVRAPGRATSWIDAKIGDWVVTPRAGRPVELNALWYNAVRIAAEMSERFGRSAARQKELKALADAIFKSFNARFWNDRESCCFDVIDDHGPDPSVRPNQLLAIALPFPVLAPERHAAVLERVRADLLTPLGPRTLSPRDPAYQGRYGGDVAARDRACHQGCVHPWLLGAMVSTHLRVHGRGGPSRHAARRMLQGCFDIMRTTSLGQLCELFDGDAPHRPGGAIASATAIGELLRCYIEDVMGQSPRPSLPTVLAPIVPVCPNSKVATKR
ncbi:MAG: amylo-alpha-1,6-glucosidase [Tepidisphaeraceae bacterium]